MRLFYIFLVFYIGVLGSSHGSALAPETLSLEDLAGGATITYDQNGEFLLGDIIIKKRSVSALGAVVSNRWTGGRIVYQFDASVNAFQQQTFRGACNAWTGGTPLTCAQRTNEPNFITVRTHHGERCAGVYTSCSELGMRKGGQDLWIYGQHWNGYNSVIQHEIGHAIGLMHEHQRPDRDSYVLILEGNIEGGAGQFNKQSYTLSGASDYDFDSIMHYANCDFSKFEDCILGPDSKQTIQALSCSRDAVGGNSITALDRQAVSRAYAPAFLALFEYSRNSSCEMLNFNDAQWSAVCSDGTCVAAKPPRRWKKVVTEYHRTCSFIPANKERQMCAAIQREYIDSWTDDDPGSCPWLGTRHEIWSMCGCSLVDYSSKCANFDRPVYPTYEKAKNSVDWRQGRALYFLDVSSQLKSDGLLSDEVAAHLKSFLLGNYMDRHFETRLARFRAGMYSYARWKRTMDPDYKLDMRMFSKIAARARLRSPN
ncbi:M12 family metallopeptidase [Mesorhizobium sp. M0938]|uniref:M12 family metallopeptidase n=1 Tax=unclassified Mesorhizobium TaxID=325217 RepID=UPI003335F282